MSGSGGGRRDDYPTRRPKRPSGGQPQGGANGQGGEEGNPCDIVQQASLNSPRADVIETMSVGDVLAISLNLGGDRPVLEVVSPSGVAGALTHRGHLTLIECIEKGREYKAVVFSKSGGAVEVRVEPK